LIILELVGVAARGMIESDYELLNSSGETAIHSLSFAKISIVNVLQT